MKVSVITPTANRYDLLRKCVQQFEAQDYPDKELLIGDGSDTSVYYNSIPDRSFLLPHRNFSLREMSLGQMRNTLCLKAEGEIILHMDDDDTYAPDWITKSVEALLACKGTVTGLSKAYFRTAGGAQWYLYQAQENAQPYVCGATMCYYRSLWLNNPFPSTNRGEDLIFQSNAAVRPHDYIHGFTANVHGGNAGRYASIFTAKEFTKIMPVQSE